MKTNNFLESVPKFSIQCRPATSRTPGAPDKGLNGKLLFSADRIVVISNTVHYYHNQTFFWTFSSRMKIYIQ